MADGGCRQVMINHFIQYLPKFVTPFCQISIQLTPLPPSWIRLCMHFTPECEHSAYLDYLFLGFTSSIAITDP